MMFQPTGMKILPKILCFSYMFDTILVGRNILRLYRNLKYLVSCLLANYPTMCQRQTDLQVAVRISEMPLTCVNIFGTSLCIHTPKY